ncbi:uncharacterized protein L199_005039 [Kwoniella botswanensis]|uniref:uncharacterized protein n=1 Tax=Kwoniella botswanensis TaxID=1268659 RepID=UPI00315D1E28
MTTATTTWTCSELLRGESYKSYALIIVNQPIRQDLLEKAWKSAKIKLCADGGANRLYDVDSVKNPLRRSIRSSGPDGTYHVSTTQATSRDICARWRIGRHDIQLDHNTMGQTCGILPVGIDSARVKTKGLKWDTGKSWPERASLTGRLGNVA